MRPPVTFGSMSNARQAVTDELVMSRILVIRGANVMLDIDLAGL